MTDDLEDRLREGLHDARLPEAPTTLHAYVAELAGRPPQPSSRRGTRRPALVAAVAMVVIGLAVGTVLLTGSTPIVSPAVVPTATSADSPRPAAGLRRFEAPGITFDYPSAWNDQTDATDSSMRPGMRRIAALTDGMTLCPGTSWSGTGNATRGTCDERPTKPGSMVLWVVEFANQPPHQQESPNHQTIAGYPVWGGQIQQSDDPYANIGWGIEGPDRGLYYVTANAPVAELASRKAEVETILGTLRLTPWSIPEEAVDGRVHLAFEEGFSFDYPAGWSVYYPLVFSMRGAPLVTLASKPLMAPLVESPCPSGAPSPSCLHDPLWEPFIPGAYSQSPGTILITFSLGAVPGIDWSAAPTTLAGQPAYHSWGPASGGGADEDGFWSVRLGDTGLGINASIIGPDAPALRATLDEVIASVKIDRPASP